MNVSYFLIQEFIELKKLRYLTVLIKLKSIYSSGRVFDYSPSKLSQSSHLSRNSVKKYINWYLDNGFARMEGDDLIFNKFSNIEKKFRHYLLKVDTSLSVKKIELHFNKQILLDKFNRFEWLKKVGIDSTSPNNIRDYKSALNKKKKFNPNRILPSATDTYSTSIKTISKHFNCSTGKAQGIINSLCEENFIKRIANYTRGKSLKHKDRTESFNSSFKKFNPECFISNGITFRRLSNIYVF